MASSLQVGKPQRQQRADGGFEGGVIAPGINLSMEALHEAAARLPRVAIRRPERVVGVDTVGAMQSGVFWGYVGLIEGLIARINEKVLEPDAEKTPG